ncbi:DUF1492 domain-containing protein [Peptostreptococcus porci]|uniref:DUF1492 domain-containing protein n=2 Tax=Peptostreptococcus porci TaxID=2652282 RepID=UPI002A91779C|nr:DUF1492 domain-containing protein [Peptostreptococcus porci]MDY5437140.1 DUF1492 domain-containing protein [Peptostreptococcus porci]
MHKDIKIALKELFWLNKSILTLSEEIEYNSCLLTKVSPTIKSDVIQSSNKTTIEDLIIKGDFLKNKLHEKVSRQIELKEELESIIETLEDIRLQDLIRRRYLRNQKWLTIANELNYSLDGVYKAHGKALRILRKNISKIKVGSNLQ